MTSVITVTQFIFSHGVGDKVAKVGGQEDFDKPKTKFTGTLT